MQESIWDSYTMMSGAAGASGGVIVSMASSRKILLRCQRGGFRFKCILKRSILWRCYLTNLKR